MARKNNPATAPEINPVSPTTTVSTPGTTTSKRNEAVKKPESYLDLNAKDVALNSSFEGNRAKLPGR